MSESIKSSGKDSFQISFAFMQRWGRLANPDYLKIYIYMLYEYNKNGAVSSMEKLAKRLHIGIDVIDAAMDYWSTNGLMNIEDGAVKFLQDSGAGKMPNVSASAAKSKSSADKPKRLREDLRMSYAPGEIARAMEVNPELSDLFSGAESALGKTLSSSDVEMIYSFYDWLGLPVEVIIMLLGFCAKIGKRTKRYMETVAIDWSDRGINTYEAAEAHIKKLESVHSNENEVRRILGISERAFTQTEKKYIEKWCASPQFNSDLIMQAYDRTVQNTGKLSYSYMNKILESWSAEGLDTIDKINSANESYRGKTGSGFVKKSKFNNYTDENKIDYSKITNKFLDDILDNKSEGNG